MTYNDNEIVIVEKFIDRIKNDYELLQSNVSLLRLDEEEKEAVDNSLSIMRDVIRKIDKAECAKDLEKVLKLKAITKNEDLTSWEKEKLENQALLSLIRG